MVVPFHGDTIAKGGLRENTVLGSGESPGCNKPHQQRDQEHLTAAAAPVTAGLAPGALWTRPRTSAAGTCATRPLPKEQCWTWCSCRLFLSPTFYSGLFVADGGGNTFFLKLGKKQVKTPFVLPKATSVFPFPPSQ